MSQTDRAELVQTLRELALSFLRDAPQHTLSRASASTLSALERLGPQRITVLAEREVVTQPAMTGLVQRLEATGYLSRCADPGDGRASLVSITPKGSRALADRRRTHDRSIDARLANLSPEDLTTLSAAIPALTNLIEITENHAIV